MDVILTYDDGFDSRFTIGGRVLARSWIWRLRADLIVRNRCLWMEELMAKDLRRLWTLLRIVGEHPLHQSDSLRAGSGYHSLQVDLLVLGHREQFSVGKSSRIRPVVNIWLAEDHRDLVKLIHFGGPREKRFESIELGHDATQSENIDRVVVGAAAEDVLWRPIPPS